MAIIEDNYDTFGNMLDLDFDLDVSKSMVNNRRVFTRYIRNDIDAVFYKSDIFTRLGLTYFHRLIPAELLDISSKGVLISSDKKIKPDSKIVLGLKFNSGKTFWIKALIVCTSIASKKLEIDARIVYKYGIKFYSYNNELGDYLLETQSELNFK